MLSKQTFQWMENGIFGRAGAHVTCHVEGDSKEGPGTVCYLNTVVTTVSDSVKNGKTVTRTTVQVTVCVVF